MQIRLDPLGRVATRSTTHAVWSCWVHSWYGCTLLVVRARSLWALGRGASAADGYWNQRQKSRTTFEGEWTRTGDKYERAKDGRYIYCGRTDDMFKVSGIWVSPFEVEQALVAHPAILEAAVVAAADAEGLEKPKAFIVMKDAKESLDQDVLKEFVKEKIGKWKYPRWVEIVEDLPKTATGKIQRFKLRDA